MNIDKEIHFNPAEGIVSEKSNTTSLDPGHKNSLRSENKDDVVIKMCHYYKDCECIKSKKRFDLCNNCPYGYISCFENIVGSIFQKTIGMAIGILNMESAMNFIRRKK